MKNGSAAVPRLRDRLRIALDMRPPRALPAAHFDRNERYAYFGDRTLQSMKSTPYVLTFLLCTAVSYGQGSPQHPSPKQGVTPKIHSLEVKDLPPFTRYDYVKSPRDPFL